MVVHTSYFYQIRFFKPYMIPFSTAVWDPKWYHNFHDQSYNFVDNNGVINGLRIKDFVPDEACDGLCHGLETCSIGDPSNCLFLEVYKHQIEAIDIDRLNEYFERVCREIKDKMKFVEEPMPVLIFHEAPSKKCSERKVVHEVLHFTELKYPIKDNYS